MNVELRFSKSFKVSKELRVSDSSQHFSTVFEMENFIINLTVENPIDREELEEYLTDPLKDPLKRNQFWIIMWMYQQQFSEAFDTIGFFTLRVENLLETGKLNSMFFKFFLKVREGGIWLCEMEHGSAVVLHDIIIRGGNAWITVWGIETVSWQDGMSLSGSQGIFWGSEIFHGEIRHRIDRDLDVEAFILGRVSAFGLHGSGDFSFKESHQ